MGKFVFVAMNTSIIKYKPSIKNLKLKFILVLSYKFKAKLVLRKTRVRYGLQKFRNDLARFVGV